MKKKLTETEIKEIAAQLRKPDGEMGVEVANHMSEGNGPMNLHTIAVLNPQAGESILEIGMGSGHFVKNIVMLDPAITYKGCDYSELMVDMASKTNVDFVKRGSTEFICAHAEKLPFTDNLFDKVFTVNTFYFWDKHLAVLKEIKRVLKPEGTFVLSIRPKHNLEKFPVTKYGFSIFSLPDITDLLKSAHFKSIEVTHIKEPDQVGSGMVSDRETLILACRIK